MYSTDQLFTSNNMYQDADLRISLYPYEFRGSHFDSSLDLPAVEDLDPFADLLEDVYDDQHHMSSDNLSLNLDSSMTDLRSLSEIDVDELEKRSSVDFSATGKILDDCPFLFKNTIKEMNHKLNLKLKNHFDEIHSLLDRMADIVVSTDPKKAAFILDYRLGKIMHRPVALKTKPRVGGKPRAKRTKKIATISSDKKKACGGNDENVLDSPSVESGLGKRNSFCSFSTAASPKKKMKC